MCSGDYIEGITMTKPAVHTAGNILRGYMFKAIIFDLDGTLYPRDSKLQKEITVRIKRWLGEQLQLPNGNCTDVFYNDLKVQHGDVLTALKNLGLSVVDYHQQVFLSLQTNRYLSSNGRLQLALESISSDMFVVTRSPRTYAESVLQALGINHLIKSILTIDFQVEKMDKVVIYENIRAEYGCHADEILIVGDNYLIDLHNAEQTGYNCVLIGYDEESDVKTIRTIEEISEIIDEQEG